MGLSYIPICNLALFISYVFWVVFGNETVTLMKMTVYNINTIEKQHTLSYTYVIVYICYLNLDYTDKHC